MRFASAERVADAVLSEGYVLYPYRASAAKNRFRWQFGIVAPADPSGAASEPSFNEMVCLLEPIGRASLTIRLRFLQIQERSVEELDGARGDFRQVERLDVEGQKLIGWQQGVLITRTAELALEAGKPMTIMPVSVAGGRSVELVADSHGVVRARRVRECWPLEGQLRIRVEGAGRYLRVRVRLENLIPWRPEFAGDRTALLRRSFVSTHFMVAADRAHFVSLLDPPADAAAAVTTCQSTRLYPVLVGQPDQRSLLLASPIALYDYPAISPQSPGDLCDSTEIDEILSLRIMALTDEEKQEARATDPAAARIIDRTDALTAADMAALHGVMAPASAADGGSPDVPSIEVGKWRVTAGSHVLLRPRRRADAMDMFLRDRRATVAAIRRDLEDRIYVAVTIDDDPAADLHQAVQRFFYFDPDEIEPVDAVVTHSRSNAHDENGLDSLGTRGGVDHRLVAGNQAIPPHPRHVDARVES